MQEKQNTQDIPNESNPSKAILTLFTGGSRSGKSRLAQEAAEGLAEGQAGACLYLATAEAFDGEMQDRIQRHQDDRGTLWKTLESPLNPAEDLNEYLSQNNTPKVILMDCLTVWVNNLIYHRGFSQDKGWPETQAWLEWLKSAPCPVIMVNNETGMGIVPLDAESRHFSDQSGWLAQEIAQIVDQVWLVSCGLKLPLKNSD